jgi:uncharacterized protein YjbI with pentapeptide repeats
MTSLPSTSRLLPSLASSGATRVAFRVVFPVLSLPLDVARSARPANLWFDKRLPGRHACCRNDRMLDDTSRHAPNRSHADGRRALRRGTDATLLLLGCIVLLTVAHAQRGASSSTLGGCDIRPGTVCNDAELSGAKLAGRDLSLSGFSQSDLSDADLSGADLHDANFRDANLQRAQLRGARMNGIDLELADLRGADLRDADLVDAVLANADLRGADLRGANLRGARLWGAQLGDTQFDRANLQRANLGATELAGASFAGADLRGTQFESAKLDGANLTGAKIDESTELRAADARGCIGCPPEAGRRP